MLRVLRVPEESQPPSMETVVDHSRLSSPITHLSILRPLSTGALVPAPGSTRPGLARPLNFTTICSRYAEPFQQLSNPGAAVAALLGPVQVSLVRCNSDR
ncbi:hypothetical protein NMY22_g5246 [Coprinellus aureogranulatus]|nr:hypothetical protein NMY22_g5246 [Coprinellus aureogranulatus]